MTEDEKIKHLGNILIREYGRSKAIEFCKDQKWKHVLGYIEKLNVQKDAP